MNLFKRAILYISRQCQKSILVFFIIFAVSTLVISGLAILDAQEEQSAELRGATGISFSVSRNTATGEWSSGAVGSFSTQEFLTSQKLEKIAEVDGIKGYNASIKAILCLSNDKGQYLEQINPIGHIEVDCQFYSFGCIDSEYNSLFLSGALAMCDGTKIDSTVDNGIIISKPVMEEMLKNYSDVGYSSADFFVTDPKQLERVIQNVQGISDIDWNNYITTANGEVYERTASSMSNVSILIVSLTFIVVIISVAIIVLILSMWLKSRKKEIGILLSIGVSKSAILSQYLLEVLFVAYQ